MPHVEANCYTCGSRLPSDGGTVVELTAGNGRSMRATLCRGCGSEVKHFLRGPHRPAVAHAFEAHRDYVEV